LYIEKCRTLYKHTGSNSKLLVLPSLTSNFSHSFKARKLKSGGVEPKEADIAGDDEMSKISKNPSDDLPNQEKNQH